MPTQIFSNIQELVTYLNTFIVPNGVGEITGEKHNNVEYGLADFIVKYTLNSSLALIHSSGGDFSLTRPITVFTGMVPNSIQWPDNIQNEYYIVNATGFNIPLSTGFSYIDQYLTTQTHIPSRTAIHIAKSSNGNWVLINNISSGSGGSLPPQIGHEGEFLMTNGSSALWFSPCIAITSADFEADGVTYLNSGLAQSKFLLFWNEVPRFIYDVEQNPSQIEWQYAPGGGFVITIPGFDATTQAVHFFLFLRGLNS